MSITSLLTGTLLDATNNQIVGGTVTISLTNYGNNVPYVSGSGTIVGPVLTVKSVAAGAWTATVICNDMITPSGTIYSLIFADANGRFVGSGAYTFIANNVYNLNATAPNVTYPVPAAITLVNANQIQGSNINRRTPLDAQILTYIAASGDWEATTPAIVTGGGLTILSPGYLLLPWDRYASTTNYTTSILGANAAFGMVINIRDTITVATAHMAAFNSTGGSVNTYAGLYNMSGSLVLEAKFAMGVGNTVQAGVLSPANYVILPGQYLYVFGTEVASASLTILAMEVYNGNGATLIAALNANSTRMGYKTAVVSAGHLISTLTVASLTVDSNSFSSMPAIVLNA